MEGREIGTKVFPEVDVKIFHVRLGKYFCSNVASLHHNSAIRTKVFPDADVKIFLDADPVIREQRRIQQQHSRGASAESMAAELRERDRRDRTRATSPLEPAPGATVLDSTALSEDEVLQRVEALVEQKLASGKQAGS